MAPGLTPLQLRLARHARVVAVGSASEVGAQRGVVAGVTEDDREWIAPAVHKCAQHGDAMVDRPERVNWNPAWLAAKGWRVPSAARSSRRGSPRSRADPGSRVRPCPPASPCRHGRARHCASAQRHHRPRTASRRSRARSGVWLALSKELLARARYRSGGVPPPRSARPPRVVRPRRPSATSTTRRPAPSPSRPSAFARRGRRTPLRSGRPRREPRHPQGSPRGDADRRDTRAPLSARAAFHPGTPRSRPARPVNVRRSTAIAFSAKTDRSGRGTASRVS